MMVEDGHLPRIQSVRLACSYILDKAVSVCVCV